MASASRSLRQQNFSSLAKSLREIRRDVYAATNYGFQLVMKKSDELA